MTKTDVFLHKTKTIKEAKIAKRSHVCRGYATTYNVEILNSFNSELQLKDTESAIRYNLKNVLTELKGLKFVTTLVLELKKIK